MSHSVPKGKRFGKPGKAKDQGSPEGLRLYLKENVLASQARQGKEGKGLRES